jgi:hypothetical protein
MTQAMIAASTLAPLSALNSQPEPMIDPSPVMSSAKKPMFR